MSHSDLDDNRLFDKVSRWVQFFYITSLKTHTFYNYSRTFTFKTAMETWLKPRTEEIWYRKVERLTSQFYQLL